MSNTKHLQIIIDEKVNFSIINEQINNKNVKKINIIDTGKNFTKKNKFYKKLSEIKFSRQKVNLIFDNILFRKNSYQTLEYLKDLKDINQFGIKIAEVGNHEFENVKGISELLNNFKVLGLKNYYSAFFQLNPKNCDFADDMLYACETFEIDYNSLNGGED